MMNTTRSQTTDRPPPLIAWDRLGVDGTARSILYALKRGGGATVTALSTEFALSGMAIRHHLAALRAKGLVDSVRERHGVGRPTEVFRLTETGDELFPRHYDELANDILATLQSLDGQETTDRVFRERQRRQRERHSAKLEGLPLEEKVSMLARILTEDGFLAESEAQGDEFILTEHNCAVNRVAQQFHQMCQCELTLISELLGADVERRQHIMGGDSCCSYVIRPLAPARKRSRTRCRNG